MVLFGRTQKFREVFKLYEILTFECCFSFHELHAMLLAVWNIKFKDINVHCLSGLFGHAAELSALQAPCIRHMLTIAKLCLVLSIPLVSASLMGVVAMQATEVILRQRRAFHITLVLVSQWNARQTPVVILCLWDVVAYRDMQETSRPQRRHHITGALVQQ